MKTARTKLVASALALALSACSGGEAPDIPAAPPNPGVNQDILALIDMTFGETDELYGLEWDETHEYTTADYFVHR